MLPCFHRRTIVHLVVLLLVTGLTASFCAGVLAQSEELFQDFRQGKEPIPPIVPFGIDADTHTKTEPEGLRFALPGLQNPKINPLGVDWPKCGISGDFEITATYELMSDAVPAKGAAGVNLNIGTAETKSVARVGRWMRSDQGNVYESDHWIGKNSNPGQNYKSLPAGARSGRLRLVRKGLTIYYLAGDGPAGEFKEISRNAISADEVANVRFVLAYNGSPVALDARLADLRVRSGNGIVEPSTTRPGGVPNIGDAAPLPPAPPTSSLSLLIPGLVGMLLVMALTIGLAAWLLASKKRRAGAMASETSACPTCGKTIKTNHELAGKKVKCGQCGQVMTMPARAAN